MFFFSLRKCAKSPKITPKLGKLRVFWGKNEVMTSLTTEEDQPGGDQPRRAHRWGREKPKNTKTSHFWGEKKPRGDKEELRGDLRCLQHLLFSTQNCPRKGFFSPPPPTPPGKFSGGGGGSRLSLRSPSSRCHPGCPLAPPALQNPSVMPPRRPHPHPPIAINPPPQKKEENPQTTKI